MLPWGTEHPAFNNINSSRIVWTPIEVHFIGAWMEAAIKAGYAKQGLLGRCRNSIARDYPDMVKHFHINHVLDINKFIYGYERFLSIQKHT
jgi:hypothetical protein